MRQPHAEPSNRNLVKPLPLRHSAHERALAEVGAGEVALATVTTREPVVVYSLSKENFLAAVKTHKSFEDQMSTMLFTRA
jgi:hypothetical protein